jgi:hypothetical protein
MKKISERDEVNMIKEYSNEELRNIYKLCKNASQDENIGNNKYLIKVYNQLFNSNDCWLHYWMTQEILKKVIEEMAERF